MFLWTLVHRNTLLTALRELAAIFHYGTLVDKMLRNRTVTGLRDHGHRERLLRDTNLTLQKAIDICRANGWVTRLGSQTAFTYASEKKKLDVRLETCENPCSSQKCKYWDYAPQLEIAQHMVTSAPNSMFNSYMRIKYLMTCIISMIDTNTDTSYCQNKLRISIPKDPTWRLIFH